MQVIISENSYWAELSNFITPQKLVISQQKVTPMGIFLYLQNITRYHNKEHCNKKTCVLCLFLRFYFSQLMCAKTQESQSISQMNENLLSINVGF